jgi:hypothetical protein
VLPNILIGSYVTAINSPAPYAQLIDAYDSKVPSASNVLVVLSSFESNCLPLTGYLGGTLVVGTVGGFANFTQPRAYCYPGGSMTIAYTVQYTESNIDSTYYFTNYSTLTFRSCVDGEVLVSGQCVSCPSGSYSLQYTGSGTACQACPAGATDCYGNTIVAAEGYWRLSAGSVTLQECPFGSYACQGGTATGDASCWPGYEGPLCGVCSPRYYLMFSSKSSSSQCTACKAGGHGRTILALLVIVPTILLVISIVMVFKFYITASENVILVDSYSFLIRKKPNVLTETVRRLANLIKENSAKIKILLTVFQVLYSLEMLH